MATDNSININNLHLLGVDAQHYSSKIYSGEISKLEENLSCSNAAVIASQPNRKRLRVRQTKISKNPSTQISKTKSSSLEKSKFGACYSDKTVSSPTNSKPKNIKRYKFKSATKPKIEEGTNLVELYHNNKAIIKSDSDESCQKQKSPKQDLHTTTITLSRIQNIPEVVTERMKMNYYPQSENPRCQLSPIGENEIYDARVSTAYLKNYELPTIASKLKQVAKGYNGFDFRTIPFCAARSTSPSHNIGINIQQVMSIMKTRQPLNGISPTLAHNIGLAAEKLHNNPISAMVSTLGSKLG